jgi:acylphosphatase
MESFSEGTARAGSEKMRAHIYISGRVQGVYFRRNTVNQALQLGLKGWVRNLADRRVETVVEGNEENIKEFIRWCHKGPPLAIVRGVEVSKQRPRGEFQTFRVLK